MVLAEYWSVTYLYWIIPIIIILGVLGVIGLFTTFFALRIFAIYTCGEYRKPTRMDGKTVIITGCTSGIGKETAENLANRGARVIMACRDVKAAEKVKDDIIDSTRNTKVLVKKLDLSSFASIREFAEDIKKNEQKLDVLIHNAGYAELFKKQRSVDDIELTMATNHYGPFLLTHLLLDLLKKNAPSRVVVVASALYRLASVNLETPNPVDSFPAYLYYASKEANILFARELARRLEGTGVTVNCLHPGLTETAIWRSLPLPLNWGLLLISKCFFKSPLQGCQTSVMLASDDKLEKVTGKYYSDCKESSLSTSVSDLARAKKFWEISERIVKLEENDPKI